MEWVFEVYNPDGKFVGGTYDKTLGGLCRFLLDEWRNGEGITRLELADLLRDSEATTSSGYRLIIAYREVCHN